MNDLEERLKALRPIQAPRAILDRARRGRRPWLLALAAAAAALAVAAFIVVSAPAPALRPEPASDYRSMVDRLLNAESLEAQVHGTVIVPLPSGAPQRVERKTTIRLKSGGRLHATIEERIPNRADLGPRRIELLSDGKKMLRRAWQKDVLIDRSEQASPEDLRARVVHWMMSTGDLHPLQTAFQIEERAALSADIQTRPAPAGYPPSAKAWVSTERGYDVSLVFDPAKAVLLGRKVALPGGGSDEKIETFRVDVPLDDALFVLPK